ncbi:transglutaminase-like domain-containing protein [Klugiella xanthotipulae]|uniref:Transglutaminase superfamily protein n=1 Tax=Klugiella xanthotipulae TaxID=244735 RepID=A0A543I4M3_9MICO|nr:transglutaminase domain-containing protein [Klugiella xanthotipulae]TQM65519.1 transglutaminase superfamily protein [Klugiella xanthotipulae]
MKKPHVLQRRDVVANTLFFVALMLLAAVSLWPIYQQVHIFVLAAVTITLGAGIALLGALTKLPTWLTPLLAALVYAVVGGGMAVPTYAVATYLPSLSGLRELVLGTGLGWKRLLTVDAPVGTYQGLMVPAFVVLLLGTVLGLSAVLRSRRFAAAGVLGPLAVYAFGIVFGVSNVHAPVDGIDPSWWLAGQSFACIALVVSWMLWRARRRHDVATAVVTSDENSLVVAASAVWPRIRAALVAGLVLLVGGSVAGVGVHLVAPATARQVLRDSIQPPFNPRDYASPLSSFRSYLSDEVINEPLFTVKGLPAEGRIRIATLDYYDGVLYRVGSPTAETEASDFSRVPFRVDESAREGEEASVTITIAGYRGVWMPTVGWLSEVTFAGSRAAALNESFFYNASGGTAVVTSGLKEGDSYTLNAVVPDILSEVELAKVTPGGARIETLDEMPSVIGSTVKDWSAGEDTPGQKLSAVLAQLREGYISHGGTNEIYSRPGHALDRIVQFLDEPLLLGDAEQYAVAMSLLAQELGYPSRVVFGFLPNAEGETVRGSNVTAWTEINTREHGWVAVDATPEWRKIPEEKPKDLEKVSQPLSVPPPPPPESDEAIVPYRPEGEMRDPDPDAPEWVGILLGILAVAGWVVLVIGVIVAPFAIILLAKLFRRRRRYQALEPLDRVTGGWREVVDLAIDHGADSVGTQTRVEYAESLDEPRILALAYGADRMVFSPEPVVPESVDHYWTEVTDLRKNWSDTMTRRQKWKSALSLRSLGWARATRAVAVRIERREPDEDDLD